MRPRTRRRLLVRILASVGLVLLCESAVLAVIGVLVAAAALLEVRVQVALPERGGAPASAGSLVLTQTLAASAAVRGEIVTIPRPNGPGVVTRRVMSVSAVGHDRSSIGLVGASGERARSYMVGSVGRVVLVIPGLGGAAARLQTPLGALGALGLGATAIAFLLVDRVSEHSREVRGDS